jgi:hypothetical protein
MLSTLQTTWVLRAEGENVPGHVRLLTDIYSGGDIVARENAVSVLTDAWADLPRELARRLLGGNIKWRALHNTVVWEGN